MRNLLVLWVFVGLVLLSALVEKCIAKEARIVIPIYTKHTNYFSTEDWYRLEYSEEWEDYRINDKVYGLAIEYKLNNVVYGIGRLVKNSESLPSNFLYTGLESTGKLQYGVALVYATGYTHITKDGVIVYPTFSIKHKWIRLSTSYPFGKIIYKDEVFQTDFINLQLVIPIK